jgi:hypothetical protein
MTKLNFFNRFHPDRFRPSGEDAAKADSAGQKPAPPQPEKTLAGAAGLVSPAGKDKGGPAAAGPSAQPPFSKDKVMDYRPELNLKDLLMDAKKKYGIESAIEKEPERNEDIAESYEEGASGTALAKKFSLSSPLNKTGKGPGDATDSTVSADSTPTKRKDSD